MKTTIKKETHLCDFCKSEIDYPHKCLKCGKESCYDCCKREGIDYAHAVHFSGSGDGWYCNSCDGKLRSLTNQGLPKDPLHSAYVAIHNFRLMLDLQYESNNRESERLEKQLKSLQ